MTITRRRAFVVEIDRSAPTLGGQLNGTVEHLDSGARTRFATSESMLSFIKSFLDADQAEAVSRPIPRDQRGGEPGGPARASPDPAL